MGPGIRQEPKPPHTLCHPLPGAVPPPPPTRPAGCSAAAVKMEDPGNLIKLYTDWHLWVYHLRIPSKCTCHISAAQKGWPIGSFRPAEGRQALSPSQAPVRCCCCQFSQVSASRTGPRKGKKNGLLRNSFRENQQLLQS
ncbi:uncharacterized protein [Miscanthus floridulus]|uniref:uncharacterized protein n=1 Tax=Miscanthus floridulus TaxID=154761 RepID=UPI003458EE19